jgi:7-cyano-7-deazaguanine reductase
MDTNVQFRALGQPVRQPQASLDTFPAPEGVNRVTFTTHELTSLCPVTGQPDLYTAEIEYLPVDRCIETKSLKLYLWTFRERGIFAEHLAAELAAHIQAAVGETWVKVTLTQQVRGGIATTVVAEVTP